MGAAAVSSKLGCLPEGFGKQAAACHPCQDVDTREMLFAVHGLSVHDQHVEEIVDSYVPIARRVVNFRALDAVPDGWRQTTERPPDGFFFLGGDAVVIEDVSSSHQPSLAQAVLPVSPNEQRRRSRAEKRQELAAQNHQNQAPASCAAASKSTSDFFASPPEKRKRILVALPLRAVDTQKTKMLQRLHSSLIERRCLVCPLLRIFHPVAVDITVLEFQFPTGEPLSTRLQSGALPEDISRLLCRDLLVTGMELHRISMTFWGLMASSMVYVGNDDRLCYILPLSCVLTAYGAQCATLSVMQASVGTDSRCLAPELNLARKETPRDDTSLEDADAHFRCDSYVIVAIVLRALLQVDPSGMQDKRIRATLSDAAYGFLSKALHEHAQWRLCGEEALANAWLISVA